MRQIIGGVFLAAILATDLAAGLVTYNGDVMPLTYGFSSQVAGADTQMSTDGNILKMATAPNEGVWFGVTSGMALSGSGNFVSLDTRLSLDATDWFLYFGDGANFAEFVMSADKYYYQTSTQIAGPVSLDLTDSYHNFSIWMKLGFVTYAVDNSVIYSGPAVSYGGTPLLIGDPSGPDLGTTGSMFVDRLRIVNGTDFDTAPLIPDSPEPTTLLLCGVGLAGLVLHRVRSR